MVKVLKKLQRKWLLLINTVVFSVLLCYFFTQIYVEKYPYYPSTDLLEFDAFSDVERSGNSTSLLDVSDSALNFKFQLGDVDHSPYSGINLNVKGQKELDISGYNCAAIDFTPTNLDHMSFFLNVEDDHVANTNHRLATRRVLGDLYVDRNQGRQISVVQFDKMESPNWWFETLNQSKKEFDKPDWSRLTSMSITNGINSEAGLYHEFQIHRIWFYRDYTWDILLLLAVQCVCIGVSVLVYYIDQLKNKFKNQVPQKIEINYKPVLVQEVHKDLSEEFLAYIHENFSNPDLSLKMVADATGAKTKLISDTIAERFECNFKTYINNIRITEAKRLLQVLDYNINEVAYMVGFNSPGHFNRVFKSCTNVTPTEFLTTSKSVDSAFC